MDYAGWKNWETWNVNLWVTTDDDLYEEMLRSNPFTADMVEDWIWEIFPAGTPDMINARAFSKVVWQELADAWNIRQQENQVANCGQD